MGAGTVVDRGLAFVSKMILARLLLKEELGLVVLILGVTALFECLTQVGIKHSVIRSPLGNQDNYLVAAWWIQVLRGLAAYGVFFAATPLLCRFYFADAPELLNLYGLPGLHRIVRVAFLTTLMSSFESPRAWLLERHFQFRKVVVLRCGASILGLLCTIVLAVVIRNTWAIVVGKILQAVCGVVLSYMFCPFLPRVTYDYASVKDLFRFARGMLGTPLLIYLTQNLDVLVGGRILDSATLGLYGYAVALARTPKDLFARSIGPVLMPAFAAKQGDSPAVRGAVLRLTRGISWLGFPATALAFAFGGHILTLVYGRPEYERVALAFGLSSLSVVFVMLSLIPGTVLLAAGQSHRARWTWVVRVALLAILIGPAMHWWGPAGGAGTLFLANLSGCLISVLLAARATTVGIGDYLLVCAPSACVSAVLFIVLRIGRSALAL